MKLEQKKTHLTINEKFIGPLLWVKKRENEAAVLNQKHQYVLVVTDMASLSFCFTFFFLITSGKNLLLVIEVTLINIDRCKKEDRKHNIFTEK